MVLIVYYRRKIFLSLSNIAKITINLEKVLLTRGKTSPTKFQVDLSSSLSTPIRAFEERCTETWTWVYLSKNCTTFTLRTSSPEPSLLGGWELVCKVHWVQFQPQCLDRSSQAPWCRAYINCDPVKCLQWIYSQFLSLCSVHIQVLKYGQISLNLNESCYG